MEDEKLEEIHKASTSRSQKSVRDAVSEDESVSNSRGSSASNFYALTDFRDKDDMRANGRLRNGVRSCRHCGHRCCQLRSMSQSEYKQRGRYIDKKKTRQRRVKKKIQKKKPFSKRTSKIVQAGSRSLMLSSLYLNDNSIVQNCQCRPQNYCEITPDMLYRALATLTKWRSTATTEDIMNYLKRTAPVNPNKKQLLSELKEKLKLAVTIEVVVAHATDVWSLNNALQKRGLTPTHVTKFWQLYGDTMKPVDKKASEHVPPDADINIDDSHNNKQQNAADNQYYT